MPGENDWVIKWNAAISSSNEIFTNSKLICINHFNENDLVTRGNSIKLKKFAVPSIFHHFDKRDQPVDMNIVEVSNHVNDDEENGNAEILLQTGEAESNPIQKQLNEAERRLEKMQMEVDQKNHELQNITCELNKFRDNALVNFAVKTPQSAQVFF